MEPLLPVQNKVGTFTELLLRIRNVDDPDYLGKIPTLDLLMDDLTLNPKLKMEIQYYYVFGIHIY